MANPYLVQIANSPEDEQKMQLMQHFPHFKKGVMDALRLVLPPGEKSKLSDLVWTIINNYFNDIEKMLTTHIDSANRTLGGSFLPPIPQWNPKNWSDETLAYLEREGKRKAIELFFLPKNLIKFVISTIKNAVHIFLAFVPFIDQAIYSGFEQLENKLEAALNHVPCQLDKSRCGYSER